MENVQLHGGDSSALTQALSCDTALSKAVDADTLVPTQAASLGGALSHVGSSDCSRTPSQGPLMAVTESASTCPEAVSNVLVNTNTKFKGPATPKRQNPRTCMKTNGRKTKQRRSSVSSTDLAKMRLLMDAHFALTNGSPRSR